MKKKIKNIDIKNKKASFEYHFIAQYIAGIVLKGTEVKSVRKSKVSLQEAYCYFSHGELWIKNMHIATYEQGNIHNHEPTRSRKLLLQKKELNKLIQTKQKGLTIVPTRLFINDKGLVKMHIALAKGKKLYDKRQSIKKKDLTREHKNLSAKW